MKHTGQPESTSRDRDWRMLRALLADDRLTDEQTDAFERMSDRLARTTSYGLTSAERDWAEALVARLDLSADVDAPVTLTPAQVAEAKRLGPLRLNAGAMAMKPPGRR